MSPRLSSMRPVRWLRAAYTRYLIRNVSFDIEATRLEINTGPRRLVIYQARLHQLRQRLAQLNKG